MGAFALSGRLGSGRASMFLLGTLSLGLWVLAVDPSFITGQQSIKNCSIWIDQLDQLPAVLTTSFFLIFSEHSWGKLYANLLHLHFLACDCVHSSYTDIKLCTYCLYRLTLVLNHEIPIWPIKTGVMASLLLAHLSSFTVFLPSMNLLWHSKTDARFIQNSPKKSEAFHTFLWHFLQV